MFKFFIALFSVLLAVAVSARSKPDDVNARTLKHTNEVHSDGSYNFAYETSNGIDFAERGIGSSYASGSYGYTSPEGQHFQLSYIADKNGYQPQGDHLPTPPPIPDYILKSLAYIETHPFSRISKK